MEPILQAIPQLSAYSPALLWLVLLCIMIIIQAVLAGVLGLAGGEETAGMPLQGDHTKRSFRVLRTYHNSVENMGVMTTTTFLAIIAGVSVAMVNWLVGLHVLLRVAYWAVYYSGVGKVGGGLRTMVYVAALLMNAILAILTMLALL